MHLPNFEEYFDDVILQRGQNYFDHGHVAKIEEVEKNHYVVEIVGSEYYTVEIFMNEADEIVDTFCDCPYDWGDFCKHQAAALFALRKERNMEASKTNSKQPSTNRKKVDLKTIVSNLEKEELVKIILHISNQYKGIEKQLLFKYAPTEDEIFTSKKMIKEYINQYKRHGFIEWNKVSDALQGAYLTLEKATEKVQEGETESAVLLGITVLSLVVDMIQYCDDSSGEVGEVIHESLAIIDEAVSMGNHQLNDRQQDRIFAALLKESLHERYEGWTDWRISLLKSCVYFCENLALRSKLEKQLSRMIESVSDTSWSSEYIVENIKLLQLEIIELFDGMEKASLFIGDHLEYSPFREKAIVHLMANGKYLEVIRLCEEGEEVDKEYRGIVHKWKKYQLQAYEGLGDIKRQQEFMLEFLYGNEFSYYARLKQLYQPDEWGEVLQKILKTLENEPYLSSVYLEILKVEKLNDKLLQYCIRYPSSIQDLYPYLMQDYSVEVNELFKKHIETVAEQASDRKKYKNVCSLIKAYNKVCGDHPVYRMIDDLKQIYRRRPAFVDELEKLEEKFKKTR